MVGHCQRDCQQLGPSAAGRPHDWTGTPGRLHHIAFATDTRGDILRAADAFLENGIRIGTPPLQLP